MRVFRKVVLPIVWVAIFTVIAVSLAVMAFGSDPKSPESGVKPTGEIPASNAGVSRGTVDNALKLRGTITVDPPISAKASHDGVINHFFVPVGTKVEAGDNLFQIKSEQEATSGGEDEDAPKPVARYHNVVAAKSGTVASFAKDLDDTVTKGDVIATIRRSSFRASGSISPVDQYRLLDLPKSATVEIAGGPAPFTCRDLTIGGPAPEGATGESGNEDSMGPGFEGGESAESREGGGADISCRVPHDVRVFDGLDMTMSIDAGRAEDVLVVPVTAVRGLVDAGSVWVLEDGKPVERAVRLGLSDGKVVEVTKGLKEGEEILEFVPGAGPGDEQDEMFVEEFAR